LKIGKRLVITDTGETFFPGQPVPFSDLSGLEPYEVEESRPRVGPNQRLVIVAPSDVWYDFVHEVCGHARKQTKKATAEQHAKTPEGRRTAVDVEDRTRSEHSTITEDLGVARSRFNAVGADGKMSEVAGALYRAGANETLASIAARCGIPASNPLDHIWSNNGAQLEATPKELGSPIKTGETFLVKGIDWYDVLAGETLESIAKKFDKPATSLQRANPHLKTVHAGLRLLIPSS
jgi:hypothetical protein